MCSCGHGYVCVDCGEEFTCTSHKELVKPIDKVSRHFNDKHSGV